MSFWSSLIGNLPEVSGPTQKKLSFKEKLKWTGITLVLYFVLGLIPLLGLGQNALQQFEYFSIILAHQFVFSIHLILLTPLSRLSRIQITINTNVIQMAMNTTVEILL